MKAMLLVKHASAWMEEEEQLKSPRNGSPDCAFNKTRISHFSLPSVIHACCLRWHPPFSSLAELGGISTSRALDFVGRAQIRHFAVFVKTHVLSWDKSQEHDLCDPEEGSWIM